MDWLNYASSLNGKGVTLLETSNHELALECFKGALEIVSLLLIVGQNGKENDTTTDLAEAVKDGLLCVHPWTAAAGSQQTSLILPITPPAPQQQHQHSTNKSDDGHNHYLFEKGLNFSADDNAADNMITPSLLSFYISVIEFNMALSLHLLSRDRLGERPLHNALHVYDYCLEHLHRSGCSMECSKLLLFAALNNKAAILYDLSSFETARDVLASLYEAINSCRNTGVLSAIDDSDLEGFLFNVMLLRGACIAPAA